MLSAICVAVSTAARMPFAPSVKTIFAPKARIVARRSGLIVSGMMITQGYPLTAATKARAIPVFPLVGSTIVDLPGNQLAGFLGRLDHGEADAILHAIARIGRFQFSENRGVTVPDDPIESNEGRAANQICHGRCDLHGSISLCMGLAARGPRSKSDAGFGSAALRHAVPDHRRSRSAVSRPSVQRRFEDTTRVRERVSRPAVRASRRARGRTPSSRSSRTVT